jgi:hypothetical protein
MSTPPRVLAATLPLLLGAGLALASWDAVGHLRAVSVQELIAEGSRAATPGDADSWTAVLIFRPLECPGMMAAVDWLNRLAGPRLSVRGLLLVDASAFPDWPDLMLANQIRFPVSAVTVDRGLRALHQLGGLGTPAIALLDPQHRLRLATNLTGDDTLAGMIARSVQESRGTKPSTPSVP